MDLFELGDMPACREEIARHARLADELRLPSFQWYTPLWAATEAALAGRFDGGERLRRRRARRASAPATATPSCSPAWCELIVQRAARRVRADRHRLRRGQDRQLAGRARPTASYLVWMLAGLGRDRPRRARTSTTGCAHELAFDANWMSAQAEVAEAIVLLGDPTHAAASSTTGSLPYAGRPATAGRAVIELRRRRPPPRRPRRRARPPRRRRSRHLRAAIDRNAALGCTVWRLHGQRRLLDLAPDDALAAKVAATAAALDLPQLA